MFNTPVPPDTLVSRQIECISCKEIFTVSEDHARRGRRQRTDDWRLPPDHYPDTELRYQPDRTRRPVTPETRSSPAKSGRFSGWNGQPVSVNCPRCGADNRNWLHLARIPAFLFYVSQFSALIICLVVLILILAVAVAQYFDPLVFLDELVAGMLWHNVAQGAPWREFAPGELRRSLSLVLTIFLAGYLPLLLIPPQWKRLREYIHLRKVRTTRPIIDISPPLSTGLVLFATFVFLVPFVLFILIPWTFDRGVVLLSPEREPTLVQRLDQISRALPAAINSTDETEREPAKNAIASLEMLVNEQQFMCERTQIEAMIGRLQLVRTSSGTTERREILIAESLADLQALRDGSQSRCREELINNARASLLLLQAFDEEVCERQNRVALCAAPPRPRECWKAMTPVATPAPLPPECNTMLITGLINELDGLEDAPEPPEGNPLDLAAVVLGNVRQLTQGSVDVGTVQRIENDVSTLETFIEPEDQGWFTAGRDFLRNWIWLVGLASLTSMAISVDAVDRYARRIDHHLPRPIFYSVANMTRVAIWDAKRSLEIDGDMSHVRWTKVERNGDGGIVLYGLHYDIFEPGQNVDPLYQKVRAQRYMISTDPWGRIQEAHIKDGRVPRPPESSDSSLPKEFFEHIPVPPQQKNVYVFRD